MSEGEQVQAEGIPVTDAVEQLLELFPNVTIEVAEHSHTGPCPVCKASH